MVKILVAADGSDDALHAAEYVANLCRAVGEAEIHVLHVIEPLTGKVVVGPTGPEIAPSGQEMDRMAEDILDGVQARLKEHGHFGKLHSAWGKPAEVICDAATEDNFDLIVMGSRGLGHITGILLGSVSDKVMHLCKVPVLIVRRPAATAG